MVALDRRWSATETSRQGGRVDLAREMDPRGVDERMLAAIIDVSADAVLVADDDRRYVFANRAACELLGRTSDEILTLRVDDTLTDAIRPSVERVWAEFMATGLQRGDTQVRRADGSIRDVEFKSVARVGEGLHVSMIRDMTDRAETERELRRRLEVEAVEHRLRAVVAALDAVIWEQDGGRSYASPQIEAMLGYPPEAFHDPAFWKTLIAEPEPRRSEVIAALTAEESAEAEFRMRRADGQVIWVRERMTTTDDGLGGRRSAGVTIEVTAQHQAEERFRTAVNLMPDPLMLLASTGSGGFVVEYLNVAAKASMDRTAGGPSGSLVPEQEWQDYAGHQRYARWIEAVRAGEGLSDVIEFDLPNGRRWLDLRAAPLPDGRAAVTWRDLTDIRASADRLQESRDRFAGAMDATLDTIAIYEAIRNAEGRIEDFEIVFANRAWYELAPLAYGEAVGKRLYELMPWLRASMPEHVAVVSDRVPSTGLVAHGDHLRDYRLSPFRDGFMVAAHDVTASARAEEDLRSSEVRYRTLVDELEAIVFERDDRTGERFLSAQAETVFGYPVAQLIDEQFWLELVVPEDRSRVREAWALRDPRGYDIDYRAHRADGREIWLEERVRSSRGADGHSMRWHGLTVDVTTRRRLEEAVARTDRLEAVGRLAAAAAHDFGNVLLGIRMFQGYLAESIPEDDPRHEDVHQIGIALERGRELTGQLLAFGKERADGPPEVVEVGGFIADLLPIMRRILGPRIEVAVTSAGDQVPVRISRGSLDQVLLNLVINARDAMPDGGRLAVAVSAERIDESAALAVPPGAYVVIGVTDTGVGMPDDVRERALEPFFTTKPHGTGLGLSSVYGTVRQAGGAVRLTSRPGRGTCVEVLLPRHQPRPAVPPHVRPSSRPPKPSKRG